MEPAKKVRGRVTEVLQELRRDVPGAREDLFRLVYAELKRLASAKMRREPAGHTLQPTALVHEAYLRLMGGATWNDRAHFFAAAAQAMRSILVDLARSRRSLKRGGTRGRVTFDEERHGRLDPMEEIVAVHEALEELEKENPRSARIVSLRFFAGLGVEETARVMGIGVRTVRRDWEHARIWLYREIGG